MDHRTAENVWSTNLQLHRSPGDALEGLGQDGASSASIGRPRVDTGDPPAPGPSRLFDEPVERGHEVPSAAPERRHGRAEWWRHGPCRRAGRSGSAPGRRGSSCRRRGRCAATGSTPPRGRSGTARPRSLRAPRSDGSDLEDGIGVPGDQLPGGGAPQRSARRRWWIPRCCVRASAGPTRPARGGPTGTRRRDSVSTARSTICSVAGSTREASRSSSTARRAATGTAKSVRAAREVVGRADDQPFDLTQLVGHQRGFSLATSTEDGGRVAPEDWCTVDSSLVARSGQLWDPSCGRGRTSRPPQRGDGLVDQAAVSWLSSISRPMTCRATEITSAPTFELTSSTARWRRRRSRPRRGPPAGRTRCCPRSSACALIRSAALLAWATISRAWRRASSRMLLALGAGLVGLGARRVGRLERGADLLLALLQGLVEDGQHVLGR